MALPSRCIAVEYAVLRHWCSAVLPYLQVLPCSRSVALPFCSILPYCRCRASTCSWAKPRCRATRGACPASIAARPHEAVSRKSGGKQAPGPLPCGRHAPSYCRSAVFAAVPDPERRGTCGLVLWVIAKAMVVDGGARRREAGPTAQRRGTSHMCSESGASEPYPPPWVRAGAYSGYRIHLDMRDSQQHRAARPPSSTRTAEPLAVAGVCVPAAVVDGPPRRDARLHTAAWIHDPGGVSSWVEPRCRTTRGAGPARSAALLRKAVSRKPGASRRTTRCTAAGCAWGCRARVTHCRSAVLPYCRCRAWPHRAGQPSRRTPDLPHSRRLSQARHTSRARSTRTAQHLE